MSLEEDIKSAAEAIEENPELLVSKTIELVESVIGSIDSPIAWIVAIFLLPTLFKFGWGIISTIFEIIWGAINMIFEIIVVMFRGLGQMLGFAVDVKRELKKRKQRKRANEVLGEYQRTEFGEEPTTHKKAKPTTPDQDLVASLKTNLLDE